MFIGRTDAEVEAPILWPPDVKSRLTGIDPGAGKEEGRRSRGRQRRRWMDSITHSIDMSLSKLREMVKDRGAWLECRSPWHREVGHNLVTAQQGDLTFW